MHSAAAVRFATAAARRPPTAFAPALLRLHARNMSGTIEARIGSLGHKLPTPMKPVANYVMCQRVGNLIYTGACGLQCGRWSGVHCARARH